MAGLSRRRPNQLTVRGSGDRRTRADDPETTITGLFLPAAAAVCGSPSIAHVSKAHELEARLERGQQDDPTNRLRRLPLQGDAVAREPPALSTNPMDLT